MKLHYLGICLIFLGLLVIHSFESSAKDTTGYLYYKADLNATGRVQRIDGNAIVLNALGLNYQSGPEGAYDGDTGTDLFLKFNDDSLFQAGQTVELSNNKMAIYVAEWGSPSAYKLFDKNSVTGKIKILSYIKQKQIKIKR